MTALPGPQLSRYLALTMLRWIGGFFLLGTAIVALAAAIALLRRTVARAARKYWATKPSFSLPAAARRGSARKRPTATPSCAPTRPPPTA